MRQESKVSFVLFFKEKNSNLVVCAMLVKFLLVKLPMILGINVQPQLFGGVSGHNERSEDNEKGRMRRLN